MTPLAFAWRSLTRQPARAVLGIAGVTVVGALLFDMLLLSRGLQLSFAELLDSVGFDVRVTASDALPGMGPLLGDGAAAARALRALPEIDEAIAIRIDRAEAPGEPAAGGEIRLMGASGPARNTWKILAGHDLTFGAADGPAEIVVSRGLATALRLAPGETLELRACSDDASARPPTRFRIAGIGEFRFDEQESRTALIQLDRLAAACDLAASVAVDFVLVAPAAGVSPHAAVEAVRRARPDLHAFSNRQLVDRLEISNFSYFRQVSFALSTITLFFTFLLTTTLLTVSVNQRLGEVAGLRALGFARRRVAADLICESALLVGAGGLLSLPAGWALATWLDAILREMPGLPAQLHFFVFQPRAVLLHALLLGAAGLLASLYPAWLAARLPIAATLRRETVS